MKLRLITKMQRRRCYQRLLVRHARGISPVRLAMVGANRSGSAGVGSPGRDPVIRLCRVEPGRQLRRAAPFSAGFEGLRKIGLRYEVANAAVGVGRYREHSDGAA
jgi:hypothetical protein